MPGRVAQSVGHLTRKSGVPGSIPVWQHIFVSPTAFSRKAVISYWRKYVHEVLVNRLGGLSLPRKSVVRLTDRPDMILDVYRGRKTIMQQQQHETLYKYKALSDPARRSRLRPHSNHLVHPSVCMSIHHDFVSAQ